MIDRGRTLFKANILQVFLIVACTGCVASAPETAFDGARAYADLEAIVAIGPRPPGSEGAARTRSYIRKEIEAAGLTLREYPFTAQTPRGAIEMTNLVAEIEGTLPGVIVIGNHYDTKLFSDFEFVGANDGGSTTAWMIEFARAIGPRRDGFSVRLCWFDGEEAIEKWTPADSLYGSRALVSLWRASGELSQVRAMINLDMIGDCSLGVFKDAGAPGWLLNLVWRAARDAGHAGAFTPRESSIEDDHEPFREAGIPAINLIDFHLGGGAVEHQMNWHTHRDRLDLVCPESLQAVGDVMLTVLPRLDRALVSMGAAE